MASTTSFSCAHTDALQSFSDPSSAKNMTHEDIAMYKCDNSTRDLLLGINPPQDFRHVVQISEHCYAVFTVPSTVNPTGYCHIHRQQAGHWLCSNQTCNKKTGNSKQIKSKKICLHQHVLFCILKLSLPDIPKGVQVPSTSSSSSDVATTVQSSFLNPEHSSTSSATPSVSRMSTIQLNLRRSIPYPVPQEFFRAHWNHNLQNWPDCFVPHSSHCDVCGSALTAAQRHPGQGQNDPSYIVMPCSFRLVEIKVKFCTNKNCKAMHQVWPVEQGLFNISDKLLVALELLVQWRELFKRGVPLTVVVESSLAVWVKCGQLQVTGNECKYMTGLFYNGFYAFELLSNRCLDSVICGICGVVGHAYFGDGNEKNCCSIDAVDYQQQEKVSGDAEQLPSLEEFLGHLKSIFVERVSYTTSLQDNTIKAARVPPIIAPRMRADQIFNTKME
ncbi:high mobility group [Desmophyllum pertusum]|uniref:High mobility group n=1 Tax=Desmophyllum pertusum TaxID=174260 RepID=A0A9W9YFD0_9CNID|nr:high mobility group [Desmophyllum pertusum]